jgi:hypothetical protein
MPITARAAADKIDELRSKLAIYTTWSEVIHASYLPSDGGSPEVRIAREDGGSVREQHLRSVLDDIEQKQAELREELGEWESLTFEPAAPVRSAPEPEQDGSEEPAPEPVKKPAPERKIHGRRLQAAHK